MQKTIKIASHRVASDAPCFIIAEAGVNHNGEVEIAKRLIDVAAAAGADAVKFQTFKAERLVTKSAPKAEYQLKTTESAESQLEMIRQLELSLSVHQELDAYCREQGILFMSTPFDEESVDLLNDLHVPVFKIGSGEITNWPLLEYIARKRKPIILSTGMSYLSEVDEALRIIYEVGNDQVILLHCVSNYPADPADVNLRAMQTMAVAFNVPVGYSDHTSGIEITLAAVALGACVIEKHFTLDRSLPGPDHRASLEPQELAAMVQGIRSVELALGHGRKEPAESEANTIAVARRSLVAACDLPSGTFIERSMLDIMRPGTGLPAAMLAYIVGRRVRVDVPAGALMSFDMLD